MESITYHNLKSSDIPFIDCNGSYLKSAFNYFVNDNNTNDFLLYFVNCELIYNNKYNKIKNVETKNPWQFQPLTIFNSDKTELFKENSLMQFINYLNTNFNIKINLMYKSDKEDFLRNQIIKAFDKNKLVIINIDEYYISHNTIFYNKIHNSHGLLLKELNISEDLLSVIDSEFEKSYQIKFNELENAFNSDNFTNYILILNGNDIINKINYEQCYNAFLRNYKSFDFIKNIINDLEEIFQLNNLSKSEKYFHLKRFHFSILFKILPYVKMRFHVFKVNNNIFSGDLEKVVTLWTMLSSSMLMQILTENYDLKQIIEILNELNKAENNIFLNLKKVDKGIQKNAEN